MLPPTPPILFPLVVLFGSLAGHYRAQKEGRKEKSIARPFFFCDPKTQRGPRDSCAPTPRPKTFVIRGLRWVSWVTNIRPKGTGDAPDLSTPPHASNIAAVGNEN
uniref:Secreted protein n=1 Tax=Trypanosoma vivax (strain Y486) TaxID=1055687 RepID=G0UD06_TRYVY|nr:hypothetical protein, unlikely [Trypanosoma vivax Y486]